MINHEKDICIRFPKMSSRVISYVTIPPEALPSSSVQLFLDLFKQTNNKYNPHLIKYVDDIFITKLQFR